MVTVAMLCGCVPPTSGTVRDRYLSLPRVERAVNTALSWPEPSRVDALAGARIVQDGPRVSYPQIAIARAILRTNPRITAAGALSLASTTFDAARVEGLPPEFLAATLLQESAYDPYAISAAGAAGIAQFTLETADEYGVDPFEPAGAIAGAARLLGRYRRAYEGRYPDPFACALAAYNAGPGAVARYGGVPPYPETLDYVNLIYERWSRIASYERPGRTSGRSR